MFVYEKSVMSTGGTVATISTSSAKSTVPVKEIVLDRSATGNGTAQIVVSKPDKPVHVKPSVQPDNTGVGSGAENLNTPMRFNKNYRADNLVKAREEKWKRKRVVLEESVPNEKRNINDNTEQTEHSSDGTDSSEQSDEEEFQSQPDEEQLSTRPLKKRKLSTSQNSSILNGLRRTDGTENSIQARMYSAAGAAASSFMASAILASALWIKKSVDDRNDQKIAASKSEWVRTSSNVNSFQ